MKLSTSGKQLFQQWSFHHWTKKFGELWSTNEKVIEAHVSHPESTVHVLNMLMHLCLGHVTLLQGKFQHPKLFPQSDLWCRAAIRWALPQISSFCFYFIVTAFICCWYNRVFVLQMLFSSWLRIGGCVHGFQCQQLDLWIRLWTHLDEQLLCSCAVSSRATGQVQKSYCSWTSENSQYLFTELSIWCPFLVCVYILWELQMMHYSFITWVILLSDFWVCFWLHRCLVLILSYKQCWVCLCSVILKLICHWVC